MFQPREAMIPEMEAHPLHFPLYLRRIQPPLPVIQLFYNRGPSLVLETEILHYQKTWSLPLLTAPITLLWMRAVPAAIFILQHQVIR